MTKNNNAFPKTGKVIGIISLTLATLVFLPSLAFTPALFISLFAFIGALMTALSGHIRVALLTLYTVIATFLVSPLFPALSVEIVFGFIIFWVIFALGLLIHFKKNKI
ncbi:MAG: hypothetical protein KAG28_09825 [Cocleimonas sp.]|nr:hypothetical protein [Cocleimonas sp.]